MLPVVVFSQGIFNESTLYVHGVSVYVDGEISNSGVLRNDGIISVSGDWKSSGKYNGDGVLELSGNTPQRISHFNQKVSTLRVGGWGPKYIKGKINISSALVLKHGIVEVSEHDFLNLMETAVIEGGSPDSYIDGGLTVEGNGYKFFPVGKNGTYSPIEFMNVEGENPQYAVELFDDAPVISVHDVLVKNSMYWRRQDIRGTFHSSPVKVAYDQGYFQNPEQIIFISGTSWDESFAVIDQVEHSTEAGKIRTLIPISSPIILLGEASGTWTQADFYFSTALSPHASHTENHKVRIFGGRLSPEEFRFQVFDRWGTLIYENISLQEMSSNGWDGRARSGAEMPTGTYPYRMTARDKTGQKFERKGVITIIH